MRKLREMRVRFLTLFTMLIASAVAVTLWGSTASATTVSTQTSTLSATSSMPENGMVQPQNTACHTVTGDRRQSCGLSQASVASAEPVPAAPGLATGEQAVTLTADQARLFAQQVDTLAGSAAPDGLGCLPEFPPPGGVILRRSLCQPLWRQ